MGWFSATASITGDKQIDRRLRALEPKVAKKYARKALREALRPAATAIVGAAPRQSGALASQIKLRATKRSRRGIGVKVQLGEDKNRQENAQASRAKTRWPFYGAIREFDDDNGGQFMEDTFAEQREAVKSRALNNLRQAVGLAATSD